MKPKRQIHPIVQLLITLSLLLMPLLQAMPAAAGGTINVTSFVGTPSNTAFGSYDDSLRAGNTKWLNYSFAFQQPSGAFPEDLYLHVFLPAGITPTGNASRDFAVLPDGTIVVDYGSQAPAGEDGATWGDTFAIEVEVDDMWLAWGNPSSVLITAWLTGNNEILLPLPNLNQERIILQINEQADLQTTIVRQPTLPPNFVLAGETVLYEVVVTNTGPSAARNVILWNWVVEDDPDRDLELVSSSVPCETLIGLAGTPATWFYVTSGMPANSGGEDVYGCSLGAIGAGEQRTLQFLYRVPEDMPPLVSDDIIGFTLALSANNYNPQLAAHYETPDPDITPGAPVNFTLAQHRVSTLDNMWATADTNV